MRIKPYPEFAEVFDDPALEGFFFPLCTVSLTDEPEDALSIHVVSSQGLWHNADFGSPYSESSFNAFHLQSDKYQFKGDIRAFTGYEWVGKVFRFLNQDFQENGQDYLATRLSTRQYQQQIRQKLTFPVGCFDLDYYLESFYTYSIVKQNAKLTGKFENFNQLIDGWKSGPQAFFYPATDNNCKNGMEELILNESYLFQTPMNLKSMVPVGVCWGEQYFDDGPAIFTFYDKDQALVYCVQHYS